VLRPLADGLQCPVTQHIWIALSGLGQGVSLLAMACLTWSSPGPHAQCDADQF
jgi:hypothetical protein